MSSDKEIETLDLLSREVVIHCRQYLGLSALRKSLDRIEKFFGSLKPDATLVALALLYCIIIVLAVPYILSHHADTAIFWIALAFIIAAVALAACTFSRESTIKLNETGLFLDGPITNTLRKSQFKWSELKQILFAENKQLSSSPNQLFLDFGLDGAAEVELSILTRADLQDILLAVALWGPQTAIQPASVAQNLGIKDRKVINPMDFTELWQNKLDSRFAPTTFVPLEKDCRLQNGSLVILGQVAMGGMAAIYLARHTTRGTVVLKESVLTGSAAPEAVQKAVELFQREAQILSKINHPRIARIYDYFIEEGRHYLMLEHIPGRTLSLFIDTNGPVSETMALIWGKQLAEILTYLHELEPPVIHRDLTPENIIVGEDGRLSIIDFGAANLFVGTATGTVIGKANYMPPEQFQGKATPQSDLYALGAVLHFITTASQYHPQPAPIQSKGEPSRQSDQSLAGFDNRIETSPKGGAATPLSKLITACLQADQKARPASARSIAEKIDAIKAGRKA